uniref:Ankyrin repeat domain 45 n=1 Tax=Sus scrofa TaxID=9823 RepID=A0A4X1UH82_PIG
MQNPNLSFWAQEEGNRPDLLCGRSADYTIEKVYFPVLVCSTIVLGGQLAYSSIQVHRIIYPLLRTPSFSLYCYFSPLIIFMAALDVDFYILKNVFWQVLLTGLISFSTAFIIIGYVVLKFNKDSWDLQSCLLFSMTLGITDPVHSVNSLKTIGISKMYTDIIRGESMIICGFTSIFFGILRSKLLSISSFKELHIIICLCLDIFGSTIIIPLLINIVDVQIKKRLSLMYSITKGYVKSQEDTKFLIRQISSRESINQVLLTKIKSLNNIPMAIPPPTPDKYLHNIVWLENKDALIEFFKDRAKLAYFDYGDIICKEGEMPQGIYLIISGMAILQSSPPTFGIERSLRAERESTSRFTEYCTSGDIIGELCCLLKREFEYTAICETILQACFISLEDLYEGFDVFWPSLEYKIWLKLALSIAYQYFESSLVDEDLTFQKCVVLNHAYVETLSSYNEVTIDNVNMKFVIVVYGSVIDTKTEIPYLAPCILPKTCEQVQGTSDLSKLLIIQASEPVKNSNTKAMGEE